MSPRTLSFALALLAGNLEESPQESARGTEVVPSASAQYYVLERIVPGGARAEATGLLVIDRAPGSLEMQIHFGEGDLHVHHVETTSASERRLIWREYGARALRTWTAAATTGEDGLEVSSWGLGEPTRRHIETRAPVMFPLECIELLRRGENVRELVRAWPLSAGLEVLGVQRIDASTADLPRGWATRLAGEGKSTLRAYRLVRADGTAAESLLFDGDVLSELELQSGDTCARLVDAERAVELLALFEREPDEASDAPREAR